ncbi:sigma-54-dependent transcriptional regulator [Denitromonas iodatirespirans]|uniref:Sigma-54-dependent Fis family transcriptional regulator n=1 Tax=Denitromonas iodatirespirans TaxID=2795389 RepID=A0A944DGZ1_DENI1|nr:sigma-54 dependent transcriptional regulator [Denitromonas iodatirespirans]MBT0962673.1 sigma-54-dependent Fis family transcriptional regulator [Denitromonas iodatirespirans]
MSQLPALLIVDDDALIVETLGALLDAEFDIYAAPTRRQAIDLVRALPAAPPLALVDLGLPPVPHRADEGFALIGDLLAHAPHMQIIVLSGQSDEGNARHARTLGALEFVAKPADPAYLRKILHDALDAGSAPEAPAATEGLIGQSPAIQMVRDRIGQFADAPFPILIEGESGAGKERVARQLHAASARRQRPFLTLNCAAIAPTLIEAALFGHARGAFTGAAGQRAGYFEEAGDGSLLLDEIGELPLELQPKLLRVLENGEFQRVGETQTRFSRARVLAATNRDLRAEVHAGRFRADLYHRLSVFTLTVPPLRDTGDDRLRLLDHFRAHFAAQTGQPAFALDPAAGEQWLCYDFPGNVRELKNIVIRLQTKHPGAVVTASQLADELDRDHRDSRAGSPPPATESRFDTIIADAMRRLREPAGFSLDDALKEQERGYVEAALRMADGNVSKAARLLGINRTTLYNRMDSLGLPRPQGSAVQ